MNGLMRRRSRSAACCAGMLALAAMACSDPTRPADDESRHEVRLQWTGATQGAFALDAEAPRAPIDYLAPVVFSTRGTYDGRPVRMVIANQPSDAYFVGGQDRVTINIDQSVSGPGRYEAGSCAQVAELPDCFAIQISLGFPPPPGGTVTWAIRSIRGQANLTITHWSPTRVVATFGGRFERHPGIHSGAPGDTVIVVGGFADAANLEGEPWIP
jgi:hypothetical protein